jgi:hypothetical protein
MRTTKASLACMLNTTPRLTSYQHHQPQIQIDIELLAYTPRQTGNAPCKTKLELNKHWDESINVLQSIAAHYTSARPRVRELRPTPYTLARMRVPMSAAKKF